LPGKYFTFATFLAPWLLMPLHIFAHINQGKSATMCINLAKTLKWQPYPGHPSRLKHITSACCQWAALVRPAKGYCSRMGSDAMGLGLGVGLRLDWEELGCGGPQCPGTFSSSDFPFARSQMFYKSFLCIFSCTSISQHWIFFSLCFFRLESGVANEPRDANFGHLFCREVMNEVFF